MFSIICPVPTRPITMTFVAAIALLCVQSAAAETSGPVVEQLNSNAIRVGKAAAGRKDQRSPASVAGKYFVEFRARHALSYGHTFLVYGRLNSRGQVGQVTANQVAGFHPAGDGPQLWSVGHILPVPAETGPSDGDMEDEYISARFQVIVDETTFRRVSDHIRAKQRKPSMWHAVMYNCNTWVGEVADYLGLNVPSNNLLFPADYIAEMRKLNEKALVNRAGDTRLTGRDRD